LLLQADAGICSDFPVSSFPVYGGRTIKRRHILGGEQTKSNDRVGRDWQFANQLFSHLSHLHDQQIGTVWVDISQVSTAIQSPSVIILS